MLNHARTLTQAIMRTVRIVIQVDVFNIYMCYCCQLSEEARVSLITCSEAELRGVWQSLFDVSRCLPCLAVPL